MNWCWSQYSDLPYEYIDFFTQYEKDLCHPKEGEWFRAMEPYEYLEVGEAEYCFPY